MQHIAALRGEADTAVWVGDCTLPPPNRGSEFSARLSAVTPTSYSAWHSNAKSTTASCSESRLSRTYRQHGYLCCPPGQLPPAFPAPNHDSSLCFLA